MGALCGMFHSIHALSRFPQVYNLAVQRATEHNIEGVTYQLAMGVVKRIIPAVASTNAVIAAACAAEAFKFATYSCNCFENYMMFNGTDGLYVYTFEYERKVRRIIGNCCAQEAITCVARTGTLSCLWSSTSALYNFSDRHG
jgi:hypothetical protein